MDFVIGQPRSGTFFLSHALNSAGRATNVHEHLHSLSGFQILTSARAYYEGTESAENVKRWLQTYRLRPEIPIDSNYILTWILDPLIEAFPEARFVHLVRDPRANVTSCCNFLDCYGTFFDDPKTRSSFVEWSVGRARPWYLLLMREISRSMPRIAHPGWDTMDQFERNCLYWSEGHRLALDKLSQRPGYLQVKMEDLTTSVESLAKVFTFLDVPAPSSERLAQLCSKPVNSSDDPLWGAIQRIKRECGIALLPPKADWPTALHEKLNRLCGETAGRLGYKLTGS